jgi:hypothetical protein
MEGSSMMDLDDFQSKDIVMDSTTKVEYMAALEVAKKGICVKKFVIKLGVIPSRLLI